ncbi:M23 family metallopeptidase [uncultured Parabacteroides sp.]|uniref:M23 family metallopeptidase n=1 Tax=uncultured Parabacteroides sp. TaxID=512312 RepID=UPI0025E77266|nr:M23 family metallopeptidase [uncultured Parabacteroides sp.]MCD7849983.1 M23 family metallopeptidase [Parabacteroides sp.]
MFKTRYSLLLIIILFALSACHSLWTAQTRPVPQPDSILILPTTDVPLPATDLAFLFPEEPELQQQTSPRKNITENFSAREKSDIAVPDPMLMADETSMLIDLGLIQKEDYAFPLPGAKVISPYAGRRRHHSGVDLKTCANDTIVSAFDGIVRLAKPYYAYGNVIVVRHYNGLETVYSHNSKNLVKPGDHIKAGQPIALTGRTGRATTEHLHFEVRVNGQHFNPNMVFNLEERKLNDQCLVFTKKGNSIAVKSVNLMPHQLAGDYSYSAVLKEQGQVKSEKGTL